VIRLLLALWVVALPGSAFAQAAEERCARVRNDDALRPYDAALHAAIVAAFARLFPQAPPPDERVLQAQTHLRCRDGHLLVCFTGANLPCGKMKTARRNQGATYFCRANPDAPVVPAYAVGHDSAYTFRCRSGKADVSGSALPLDKRGFAAANWTQVD